MSLKHWWPLVNDFYDRVGGNHLRFLDGYDNGHVALYANGKFGTCYGKASTGKVDFLRSTNKIGPFTEESICGWFLVTEHADLGTANGLITHHNHATHSGLGIGVFSSDGSKYYTSVNAGTGSDRIHSDANYRGSTDIKGAWHHICLTYAADGKIRMYVDGKEDMTARSYSLYSPADYFDLFNWSVGHYSNGSYRPASKMTDIRIYDHALSLTEVQELAKGLAVHYTFNQLNSKNICDWRTISTCQQGGWTGSAVYQDDILTLTATNGWRSFMWDIGDENVGKPITFSYEYKILDKTNAEYITTQHHTTSYWGTNVGESLDLDVIDWTKKTVTITSPQKYVGIMIRGTDNTGLTASMQIRNVKIALNSFDDIYTEYSSDCTRCTDDSGWNNNGICYKIGISNNVKRGSKTALFDGNYSYITSPNFKSNLPNEDYTLSFWIYPLENGVRDIIYGNHAGSIQSFSIERYTGNQLRIYYHGDTPGYISEATMLANEWTHIAIVRKGNNIIIWRNGQKVSDKSYTLTTLNCNNANYKLGSDYRTSDTSTEATRFKGYFDDFRIYVTALDETAIKDLYEPAIYMTTNDSFMANEFIEMNEIEMTTFATVKSAGFTEEINKNYEILEYIASSGTQYINSGYIPKTNFRIELDMAWTGSSVGNFESFAGFMHSNQIPRAGVHKYSSVFMLGGNATTVSTVTPIANQRTILISDFYSENQCLYKNGIAIINDKTKLDLSANEQQLYIFGRNASSKNLATMRLYKCRIFDNVNTLIRDFIPARRKSDSVLGLYDAMSGNFYANSGTGTFIAGPTLSNDKISMYTLNTISAKEFIEF